MGLRTPSENTRYNTRLDHGPALYVADRATLSDPRLIRYFVKMAEEHGIPFQIRQPGGGGTDAGAIHKQRAGIPSLSISVPGRYMHTAASIVRIKDWQNTLNLVSTAFINLNPTIFNEDRGPCFMGVDQGKDLHVVVGKKGARWTLSLSMSEFIRIGRNLTGLCKTFTLVAA